MNDYASQSGDVDFAREKWDNIWRAYQFLHSTYDAQGLAQNVGVGHGWVEGGPLLPVKNEYYQADSVLRHLRALSNLARLVGKDDISKQLAAEFEPKSRRSIRRIWSPDEGIYAFALKRITSASNEASVLTTVPMWFGLPDAASRRPDDHETRCAQISRPIGACASFLSNSKVYDGSGYHYGAVWPLFTGWASVGEYRYHRPLPAYPICARTLCSRPMGRSVISPKCFLAISTSRSRPARRTRSGRRRWSSARSCAACWACRPMRRAHEITFAPHVPADWTSFAIRNVRVAGVESTFNTAKLPTASGSKPNAAEQAIAG